MNKWTTEQEEAINFRGNNVLVSASAGSGKTAVLVERIINRVINENVDVDKLLVVTFTNAAASELKERVYKKIKEKLEEEPKNMHLRSQLKKISSASITTIHAFCMEIIRSNFYKIGLDPSFSVCDDTKAKLLRKDAMEELITREYSKTKDSEFSLYNVLELFNLKDEEYINCVNNIVSEINCYARPLEFLKEKIEKYNITDLDEDLYTKDFGKEIVDDAIENVKIACIRSEEFRKKLEAKGEEFKKYIELIDLDISNLKSITGIQNLTWDKLYDVINNLEQKNMPKAKVEDENLKEELKKFRDSVIKAEINSIKQSIYSKSKDINKSLLEMKPYLDYIYYFIEEYEKIYTRLKNEENLIDFTDIELYALDILLEKDEKGKYVPTLEAKNYVDKFDEIYIDEYQDTSYIQEEILNAVSKKDINNKFMVGDIKQSIYKFRHAAVDIFIDKYLKYDKEGNKYGKKIILAKNFRSRKEVLNGINYIFEKTMSASLGDCNYSGDEVLSLGNMDYLYNEKDSYNFEINFLNTTIDESQEDANYERSESSDYIKELKKNEHEAVFIAERINKLINIDKFEVMDKDTQKLRKARYSDVCILLRSTKNKSEIYENALKKINIPVYSSSSSSVFENDEVSLIISFLKVIDNPLQDIEMISIMYSIFGKFTLDEIYDIKSVNLKSNIYDILASWEYNKKENEVIDSKIKNFVDDLNKYIELSSILDISELISKIFVKSNLYNYVLLLDSPNVRKMNLNNLLNIAESLKDKYTLSEFIEYIEVLKTNNINVEQGAKVIGENEDVVRIMTIHASKGLEFPIVILGGITQKYNTKDVNSRVMLGKYGIGIDYLDKEYRISYPTVIKEAINQKTIKENKSEELRMLYVALTRAREKIITYIPLKDVNKKLESIFAIYDDNSKIESKICMMQNSYADIIMLAIKKYIENEEKGIFDINMYNLSSEDTTLVYENYTKDTNVNIQEIFENMDFSKLDSKKIQKIKEETSLQVELDYKNVMDTLAKRRTSVSSIKKSFIDQSEVIDIKNDFEKSSRFNLEEAKQFTGARKGTLIHFILEKLDLKKVKNEKELNEFLNDFLVKGYITNDELKCINKSELITFINSSLADKIRNSKSCFKEKEFIYKNSSYAKGIVQGVIDLYFEDDTGKIYIVDYKTDNLENEKEFSKRYKVQLDIYKEALEKIIKKQVDKVFIYSLKLGKEIEIT